MKSSKPSLESLKEKLLAIRKYVLNKERDLGPLSGIHPSHQASARNLVQYMAFRTLDIRELQILLTEWGLSSLSKTEKRIQASLDAVLEVMHRLQKEDWRSDVTPPVDFIQSRNLLDHNTEAVIGPVPVGRRARILVTLPTEASTDYQLVEDLMKNGMNGARINCAHDSKEVWEAIISNVKQASQKLGKPCKIFMDIAGPKLRTGRIPPSPMVVKVRPVRNDIGEVQQPAEVLFFDNEDIGGLPLEEFHAIPVDQRWLNKCKIGDVIRLSDARGSKRQLRIVRKENGSVLAEAKKTTYFTPGLKLDLTRSDKKSIASTLIAKELPGVEGFIRLHVGDELVIKRVNLAGRATHKDKNGEEHPATIGCTLPEFMKHVKVGDPIWLDDGKIGGYITRTDQDKVVVRINQAKSNGSKLKSEKGINLPQSDIRVGSLTKKDLEDLKFVVAHADAIGHSFVNVKEDVEDLLDAIRKIKRERGEDLSKIPALVVKIETEKGFNNLPEIILAGMQVPALGVMIARGDLAIECGFGRLAELQEEILWVCEAAHIPAIWATQVLEGMAKGGLPTRAEVTDAAMGQRAECIMLNKGEYIVEATRSLDDILKRMQDHQTKKRTLLRKLNMAVNFFERI